MISHPTKFSIEKKLVPIKHALGLNNTKHTQELVEITEITNQEVKILLTNLIDYIENKNYYSITILNPKFGQAFFTKTKYCLLPEKEKKLNQTKLYLALSALDDLMKIKNDSDEDGTKLKILKRIWSVKAHLARLENATPQTDHVPQLGSKETLYKIKGTGSYEEALQLQTMPSDSLTNKEINKIIKELSQKLKELLQQSKTPEPTIRN